MNDIDSLAPLPSPLEAIPDMRATAKWTVASLGVVGAALLTVVPFSVLDRLHGTGDLIGAATGLVLSGTGVAWAIWHTAEALTPPVTTLADIDTKDLASLRRRIQRSPESFFGPFGSTLGELASGRRFHELVHSRLLDAAHTEQDPARAAAWRRALEEATANVTLARSLQRRLLEFAHAWQVRSALRRARAHSMVGTAVIVLGLVLIMFVASSS